MRKRLPSCLPPVLVLALFAGAFARSAEKTGAHKAARDGYLAHALHKQFVEENKAAMAQVRVFDSYLVNPR